MRLIGKVARFGKGGTDLYNVSKGKILLTLATNPNIWATAMQLSATTGISRASLFVLLQHWSRPNWKIIKRAKFGGFYRYQISLKGQEYFQRWFFLMPIRRWESEIKQWQSEHASKGIDNTNEPNEMLNGQISRLIDHVKNRLFLNLNG